MSINLSSIKYSLFCIMAAALLTTACGSSRTIIANSGSRVERKKSASHSSSATKPTKRVEFTVISGAMASSSKALLTEAKKWIGTPYRYGGEDRSGVDCSALVLNVYRDALNIKLPRSSGKQMEESTSISKRDLIPGDLLFFATSGGNSVSHVGLYIGEGKMIHASSSRGVMVSMIDEDYFVKTFAGAGRIDAYYAMVNKNMPRKEPLQPINETVVDQPFRFEPVPQVPQRVAPVIPDNQPAQTPAPITQPVPSNVKSNTLTAATQTSANVSAPDISADEARRQVLNSLIEQKLDSIYSSTIQ